MILETIRKAYSDLTKSQKQVADYLLASYRDAVFMTASRMADELSMNEATVIRFAQRLGYPGYPDMLSDLQEVIQEELAPTSDRSASDRSSLLAMLDLELDTVRRFSSHMSPAIASQVIERLIGPDTKYVLGQGLAQPLASLLSLSLQSLGFPAQAPPTDPLGLASISSSFEEGCGVIAISLGAQSRQIAKMLCLADERGAWTFALSDSPISECAQAAQLALSCPACKEMPTASLAPIALLIDAILQCVAERAADQVALRRQRAAEAQAYMTNENER